MQSGNGSSAPITSAQLTVEGAAAKPDVVRQLLGPERAADGGIIAQLTSNPFFTAVSSRHRHWRIYAYFYRVLDLLVWELLLRSLVEAFAMAPLSYVAGFWLMSKSMYRMILINGFYIG